MSEFQREDRYIVIKRSDLKKVPVAYRSHLVDPMFSLLSHLPRREFVVVESDWPEFEPVWRMIEARVTGTPPPHPQFLCVRYDLLQECSYQDRQYVSSVAYDALSAQRDEGLVREAELLEQRDSLANEMFDLQQRLAEATDLLKHMTCSYHRALENGYDRIIFLGGDCDSVDKMEKDDPFYAKARAFLANPSRADQEQPS
jgi:hypothetical protein